MNFSRAFDVNLDRMPAEIAAAVLIRDGRSIRMFDLILVALGLGFFVASIAYAYVCDRL